MTGKRLLRNAGDFGEGLEISNPGRIAPGIEEKVRRWLLPLLRLCHRPVLSGTGNLPEGKPFLLVANHSAGTGIAEILCFLALYLRDVGAHRPMAGFALPLGFHVPGLRGLLRGIGAVPSTYDAARKTLAAGVPLLIFPGGDHETLRPFWQANKVDFGGRTGFLRVAREAKVPVVPMGIRGSHMTCPILFRSEWLANLLVLPRLVGLKRWGISLSALIGTVLILALLPLSLPWRLLLVYLWLSSALTLLPFIPWNIRQCIGVPIAPEELFPAGMDEEAQLRHALLKVQGAVQALVDNP